MREILFRGKRIDGLWVEGAGVTVDESETRILSELGGSYGLTWCRVYPETVGQYTGLTDKNGKKIFEGDIVKVQDDILGSPYCGGIIGKVVYDEAAFFIEPREKENSLLLFNECAVYEIIGNIHDTPELLEVSHE